MAVTAGEIRRYVMATFAGIQEVDDDGNWFFFYDSDNKIPFATIVTNDKYDSYSRLGGERYRLNMGTGKDTYRSLFPIEEKPLDAGFDFTSEDRLMPHPEYGRIFWTCVINPSPETWQTAKPMLAEAYEAAVRKFEAARAARRA